MLLDKEYQDIRQKCILTEISLLNRDANPNTLWEIVIGTIRNETIKFATHTKKQTRKQEETIENDFFKLKQNISETSDHEKNETLKINIQEKKKVALEKIN